MAPNRTTNRIQRRVPPPGSNESFLSALTTGAASSIIDCQGTSPERVTATPTYSSVQITSVAMIPKGMSRCGLRASSAAVETESNPI